MSYYLGGLCLLFLWCVSGSASLGRNNLAVFWSLWLALAAGLLGRML